MQACIPILCMCVVSLAWVAVKGWLGFNFAKLFPARSLGDPTVHLY